MTPLRNLFRPVSPVVGAACVLLGTAAGSPAAVLFQEISSEGLEVEAALPSGSRYFDVDLADMRGTLAAAPAESFDAPVPGLTVALPMPDNRSEEFSVWETDLMHPDLAAKYPEIKTYTGRGIDNPYASVRITITPAGFHAMVLSEKPTVFIDPVARGDNRSHASHYKSTAAQVAAGGESLSCQFESDPVKEAEIAQLVAERKSGLRRVSTGQELRTYRTCVAATGEYTAFHGGTKAAGQAAIVVSMNRVTGIYEREVSVRFQLIANNDLVVYTNGATDPYTNSSGSAMLGQNQTTLNSVIGSANYDVGHVFSTGGGGIASLAVICSGSKARGVTGRNAPIGDAFDVDFVAHEIGHQFGGTHTFNGTTGNCSGGNRTGTTAYETGSGVTIMGYAGICGAQNIATNSIDIFHPASFDQITAHTQSGGGSGCPTVTATGNLPPVVTAGNTGLTIPIDTPFIVYGSMTEPDGDAVTYNWEQFDLGPAGDPAAPTGNAPIFRDWISYTREWRMFPRKKDVRDGTSTYGELLPSYSRNITLRLTIRDGLGGVGSDTTTLAVDGGSGPFLLTSEDTLPWNAGETKTITWDVANTDVAPVNAPLVNIVLSLDDGRNFTETLVANTPNDGTEDIIVPAIATTQARVQVEATNNVFFDMNDTTFEIVVTASGVDELAAQSPEALRVRPNPFNGRTTVSFATERRGDVSVAVYDAAGREVTMLAQGVREAGQHSVTWNGRDASGTRVAAGVYFVRMDADGSRETTRVVHLK